MLDSVFKLSGGKKGAFRIYITSRPVPDTKILEGLKGAFVFMSP